MNSQRTVLRKWNINIFSLMMNQKPDSWNQQNQLNLPLRLLANSWFNSPTGVTTAIFLFSSGIWRTSDPEQLNLRHLRNSLKFHNYLILSSLVSLWGTNWELGIKLLSTHPHRPPHHHPVDPSLNNISPVKNSTHFQGMEHWRKFGYFTFIWKRLQATHQSQDCVWKAKAAFFF